MKFADRMRARRGEKGSPRGWASHLSWHDAHVLMELAIDHYFTHSEVSDEEANRGGRVASHWLGEMARRGLDIPVAINLSDDHNYFVVSWECGVHMKFFWNFLDGGFDERFEGTRLERKGSCCWIFSDVTNEDYVPVNRKASIDCLLVATGKYVAG